MVGRLADPKANPLMPLQISKLLLDQRNVELLRCLCFDPRMNLSELARRIGMSTPAVRERLQKLEDTGVIGAWKLELDPKALGYPITAFVRIRPGHLAQDRRARAAHAAGDRSLSHHRRGLLPREDPYREPGPAGSDP